MVSNTLIDNHKQAILTLLQNGTTLLTKIGDEDRAQRLREVQRETEEKQSPAIMFYGLYNAGKSTIINALFQKEIAPTGDVPTTTAIQEVPWEGYTLIDTPGIDARAKDTEIAQDEIRRSDVVLFVMDNADTFDNAIVYQAIVDILKMGKPLAIVINQKNVDENEDPNTPVPDQNSIRKIVGKVSSNLEVQGAKDGMQIVGKLNNFLGIFPVNALTAFEARMCPGEAGELLYRASGVLSLRNALNESIRRSEFVYMLRTPLINLREVLREAVGAYQDSTIYGEKEQLAKNRESLLASRQRLRDRLMADGLRKIEAVVEQMKTAAANGQSVEGMDKQLNEELTQLLQNAVGEEQMILQREIVVSALPGYTNTDLTVQDSQSGMDDSAAWFAAGGLAASGLTAMAIPPIVLGPLSIPVAAVVAVVAAIIGIFSRNGKQSEDDANRAARESQEKMANYYRWQNELRDQEFKIKASYEKSVNDFLQQYYEPKLVEINKVLAEVDGSCAEHTKYLRELEQLQLRVGDEMAALVVSA